jgi:hypothetical protein
LSGPLELEFHKADSLTNATAYFVVNGFDVGPNGLLSLTDDCVSMAELEGELCRLEDQIREIRASAEEMVSSPLASQRRTITATGPPFGEGGALVAGGARLRVELRPQE